LAAIHSWHVVIDNSRVNGVLARQLDSAWAICHGENRVAFGFKECSSESESVALERVLDV